jgi:hypothetical protein
MNPNTSFQPNSAAPAGIFAAFMGTYLIVVIGFSVFMVYCYWRICTKAGFPGPLALLSLVPCVNFLMPILFAFVEWPIERQLKMMGGGPGGPNGPSPYFRGGPMPPQA